MNAQRRSTVGIIEEPLRENEVEQEAQRDENGEGPPESAPWNVQPLAGQEPSCDQRDGENEQQKAKSVATWCGVLIDWRQGGGDVDGVQRDGRGKNKHRQHSNDDCGAGSRARESVRSGSGHGQPPVRL